MTEGTDVGDERGCGEGVGIDNAASGVGFVSGLLAAFDGLSFRTSFFVESAGSRLIL
jgi:hypothetical protein